MAGFLKYFLLLLAVLSSVANSSDTPLSGTFSNASEDNLDGTFNLVVTSTENGQQFFLQCFKQNKVEFGVVTHIPKQRVETTINAGSNCPNRQMQIRLDYEEAYIKVKGKWVEIPRGQIYVPIVD